MNARVGFTLESGFTYYLGFKVENFIDTPCPEHIWFLLSGPVSALSLPCLCSVSALSLDLQCHPFQDLPSKTAELITQAQRRLLLGNGASTDSSWEDCQASKLTFVAGPPSLPDRDRISLAATSSMQPLSCLARVR